MGNVKPTLASSFKVRRLHCVALSMILIFRVCSVHSNFLMLVTSNQSEDILSKGHPIKKRKSFHHCNISGSISACFFQIKMLVRFAVSFLILPI
ncbi:hypothetical protein phiOC_p285 [Ochrobactrum phage vB_OspM_OC]|nr:hypothetical protein phiOC_p285 [Ochrobactrum phage vB_OspM_OC]